MRKRIFLLWILATLCELPAQTEQSISGVWEGTMMLPGSIGMVSVTFHITPVVADSTATIEASEEKLSMPIRIKKQQKEVVFDLQGAGRYEGTIEADDKTILGKWKQGAIGIPLTLHLILKSVPDTKTITKWVQKNSIPLKTIEPQSSFEDLIPLKKMVGNARIVAMGEATHGTHEFFLLKHRIFEFLVEQMGFTVFALEANLPEARVVNEYVLNGNGDPRAALHGLYSWPWKTEELLGMVEWMRTYNANPEHKRKVKFYGFDMQVANLAVLNVIAYLKHADPEYGIKAEELLSSVPITEVERNLLTDASEENKRMREHIHQVLEHIDTLPHDEAGWRNARQDAVIIQQAVQMMIAGNQRISIRDEAMAANVAWILEQEEPEAKIMLWAHNGHVRTTLSDGRTWMGGHLRKCFGNEMVVIGFVFNQGSFQAIETNKGLREFTVKTAPSGSMDAALEVTKIPLFALDLRAINKQPVTDWFKSPQKSREIGAGYSDDMESWMLVQSPAEAFDILLFVDRTSPTHSFPPPAPLPPPVQEPIPPIIKKPFWEIGD
jgi:erythromycin esterase